MRYDYTIIVRICISLTKIYLIDNYNLLESSFISEVSFTLDLRDPTIHVLDHNLAVVYPGVLYFVVPLGQARFIG